MAKMGTKTNKTVGEQEFVREKRTMGAKSTKKTSANITKDRKAQGKSGVSFFRSIRFRLTAAFIIPVICIIVLGYVSYMKASDAIVNSYRTSTEQTAEMLQQYISLIVASEKDEFKTYLNDDELQKYINGLYTAEVDATTKKSYKDTITSKMALDTKLESVLFLLDGGKSIYVASSSMSDDAYTSYISTTQGAEVAENRFSWFVFGQDEEADASLNIDSSSYVLRLARRMNDMKAIMILNLDASFIRNAMVALDPGDGGYVAVVSANGAEFFSDSSVELEESIIYGTDFYKQALEGEAESGSMDVVIDGQKYLFVYSKLETGDAIVTALVTEDVMLAETADIKQMSVLLTLVAVVIALFLGMLISRQISGAIQYILRKLQKVSKGDLTVQLKAKKKDEFGLLCVGVNETVENVKGLIVHVNEVSTQLNNAAAYVSDASGTFMETSRDIQNAVSEIEVGVNRLDSDSENCLTQMDSLSGKITNVSRNADEIGELMSTTGHTITNGIESVQGLTESARSTTAITQNMIVALQELEAKSKSISGIVSAINDIAEQTNLLSLNASIEAARVGAAGKGFAVVAEEIRKLSDQCQDSAGQISDIVNEIVGKTGDVVSIAKRAEEIVSTQAGAVEETTTSFHQIDQQVESLFAALDTISSNVQEMSGARSETLEAIEGISAVSAKTSACSSSVYSSANSQMEAIKDLDRASSELRQRADSLVEILKAFTV